MQKPWVSKAEYIAAKKAEGTYKPKSSAYAARPMSYTGRKKVRAPVSYKPRAVNKAQVKKAAAVVGTVAVGKAARDKANRNEKVYRQNMKKKGK